MIECKASQYVGLHSNRVLISMLLVFSKASTARPFLVFNGFLISMLIL